MLLKLRVFCVCMNVSASSSEALACEGKTVMERPGVARWLLAHELPRRADGRRRAGWARDDCQR